MKIEYIEKIKAEIKSELLAEIQKEEKVRIEKELRQKEWARKELEYLINIRDSKVAEWNDSYRKQYSDKVENLRHRYGI